MFRCRYNFLQGNGVSAARFLAVALLILVGVSTNAIALPWTPADTNTVVWYDAADTNTITATTNAVSQWNDKSGNGRHATQGTSSAQPKTGTRSLNGLNVIDFDGGDKLISSFTLSGNRSAYVVFKLDTSDDRMILDNRASDSATTFFTSGGKYANWNGSGVGFGNKAIDTSAHFRGFIISGTLGSTYHDGAVDATLDPVGTKSHNGFTIGARYDLGLKMVGPIAEIILCAGAHDTETRQKVEGYLAHKWGLDANLPSDHPYKKLAPGEFPLGTVIRVR